MDRPDDIFEWRRAWVGGRAAYYGVAGSGLPVLFLHGWGLGHRTYREPIRRLVDMGCRVYAPALPGFGGTAELRRREYDLAGYARWVDRFLATVRIDEPVMVVGHSFGGGVAIATAHDVADRVRSLVLVNSIGGSIWKRERRTRSMAERPLWDWGINFPRDVWPLPQAMRMLPSLVDDALPNVVRNPMAMWRVGHLARTADLRAELEELRARGLPVMIVWGSADGVIPEDSFRSLCRGLGRDGTVVDGAHGWLLADPDGFGQVITNAVEVAQLARGREHHPAARRR